MLINRWTYCPKIRQKHRFSWNDTVEYGIIIARKSLSFRASACFFRRVAAAIATPPIWYRGGGFTPAPPSISWALVCMIWFNPESQDHPEREKIKYERW